MFTALRTAATSDSEVTSHWNVIEEWYKRDENALPPVYVLQPISSKIENYNSSSNEERQAAAERWNDTNATLQTTLRKAASVARDNNSISAEEAQTFFISG